MTSVPFGSSRSVNTMSAGYSPTGSEAAYSESRVSVTSVWFIGPSAPPSTAEVSHGSGESRSQRKRPGVKLTSV